MFIFRILLMYSFATDPGCLFYYILRNAYYLRIFECITEQKYIVTIKDVNAFGLYCRHLFPELNLSWNVPHD